MKILIVNDKINLAGGAEVYGWTVAKGLRQRSHLVTFLAGEGTRPDDIGGVEVLMAKDLRLDRLEETLEGKSFEIAYLQNISKGEVVDFFAKRYSTIRFIHDHATYCPGTAKYWFAKKQPCDQPLSWRCCKYAWCQKCMSRNPKEAWSKLASLPKLLKACQKLNKLVAASEYVKSQLVLNGLMEQKIDVNPLFGFEDPIGHSVPELDQTGDGDKPAVLFVGRIFLEKGLGHLLRASRVINTPHQIRVVGDGWDLERCKKLAGWLDISHQVKFLGWLEREKVREEIKKSYLLVVPSLWPEPFGLVGIEAMSYAKPVVSYGTGGIGGWLKDGQNGLVAQYGDISSLAQAIDRLLSDPSLASRLGSRGLEMAKTEFSLSRHLDQLERLFLNYIE